MNWYEPMSNLTIVDTNFIEDLMRECMIKVGPWGACVCVHVQAMMGQYGGDNKNSGTSFCVPLRITAAN